MSENTKNTGIDRADHAEAMKSVAEELATIEDAIAQGMDGDNNPDVAMRRLVLLGTIQHLQGNIEPAKKRFEQALQLARGLYGEFHHHNLHAPSAINYGV